ncbi:DUF6440 family protein [Rhodococcus sp. IEGM 1408]|uniref:DUF6440 family protein n=1 Tax=Rhodococcus sp. IEGM 1408 TaxID=3082220 RepID=UPI002955BAF2|nr:DUF6440 family protein [Rhodococcus sp. IEGM 1408]MDV8003047.1 DUF6440 family protein [Rhodococcus sp. IEGM 1408]
MAFGPGKKRFEIVLSDASGGGSITRILRDKETGVCYVFHMQGVSSGLTLLVDAGGNPVTI